jgi:hypothetical protein
MLQFAISATHHVLISAAMDTDHIDAARFMEEQFLRVT